MRGDVPTPAYKNPVIPSGAPQARREESLIFRIYGAALAFLES
jgi:hypothetical protein